MPATQPGRSMASPGGVDSPERRRSVARGRTLSALAPAVRRHRLSSLVLGSTVALLTASATPAPPPPGPVSARAAIEARLLPLIDRRALVRADGYLYAIDI